VVLVCHNKQVEGANAYFLARLSPPVLCEYSAFILRLLLLSQAMLVKARYRRSLRLQQLQIWLSWTRVRKSPFTHTYELRVEILELKHC